MIEVQPGVSVLPAVIPPAVIPAAVPEPVVAKEVTWPFPMWCSCLRYGSLDRGLCCYAFFCPSCLAAEIAQSLDLKGCCGSSDAFVQWSATCAFMTLTAAAMSIVGMSFLAPWACTIFYSMGRDVVKIRYDLPPQELCGTMSCTSFMPCCCLDCSPSALYQEAYLLKHDLGHTNFPGDCCCVYNLCCA